VDFDYYSLDKAFSLNTSGNGLCYYGATIGNKKYEGERNWDDRWKLLKDCTDYTNKNVVEIGCNMGIFLAYLKRFCGINRALGIDLPNDLLVKSNKKDTIIAAKLLAAGLMIDIELLQIDLNSMNYPILVPASAYDIAIVLSIYKWINDKKKFLDYLSNFKTVIYEGHEDDDIEIARFAKHGFSAKILGKTQIGKSYSPDQYRTLILFTK